MHLIHLGILIVITVVYTLILTRTLPENQWELTNKAGGDQNGKRR